MQRQEILTYCAAHDYTTEPQIKTILFCGTVPKTGFLGKNKYRPKNRRSVDCSAKKRFPEKSCSIDMTGTMEADNTNIETGNINIEEMRLD